MQWAIFQIAQRLPIVSRAACIVTYEQATIEGAVNGRSCYNRSTTIRNTEYGIRTKAEP